MCGRVAGVCVITAGAYMLNANGATGEEGKLEKSPRLEEGGIVAEDSVNTFGTRRRPSARGPLDQLVPAGSPWHFDDAELSKRGCLRRSLTTQMSTLRANPGSLITLGIAAMYALVADLDKLGKLHTTDLLVFMFIVIGDYVGPRYVTVHCGTHVTLCSCLCCDSHCVLQLAVSILVVVSCSNKA